MTNEAGLQFHDTNQLCNKKLFFETKDIPKHLYYERNKKFGVRDRV
jgi:hypothetical protein